MDGIQALIARLGDAISNGDAKGVAECWAVPALALADEGARPVTSEQQIVEFFEQSIAAYRKQGIVTAKGELLSSHPISDRLMAIEVRWPGYDKDGVERNLGPSVDRSHYIVWRDDDGQWRVRVSASLL